MRVLQPGEGRIPGDVYLPTGAGTALWGRLPAAGDVPVLTVASGTTVTVDTVSHEGLLDDQGRDPVAWFGSHGVAPGDVLRDAVEVAATCPRDPGDGPHVVTGPIAVTGARPGDLLAVSVLGATPRVAYGVVCSRHGRGALPGELPRARDTVSVFVPVTPSGDGWVGQVPVQPGGGPVVSFPLRPFPGIVGVTVDSATRPHSVPPGPHGGNLDINLLGVGSTVFLPVQVPGAGVYVGDPHFAQGDGEVALTALEASLRLTVRLEVIPRADADHAFGPVIGPLLRTPDLLVPTGLDPDLDEAVRRCVRASLSLLTHRYQMAEHLAYAYLSAAVDVNISQVVDQVCGAHARIRLADFAALEAGRDGL